MIKKIHMSILLKTTALITVLCLLIMSYSTYVLYSSWTSYQQVIELRNFQDMTQNFTDGLKNFMFERGRMNVVLTKEQSISDENSVFINERRMAADAAFEAGFSCMEKAFPKETEKLQKYYENINKLRIKIDLEGNNDEFFVVGEVLSCEKHPDADKLKSKKASTALYSFQTAYR